jgi:hypothetical protein
MYEEEEEEEHLMCHPGEVGSKTVMVRPLVRRCKLEPHEMISPLDA